MPTGDYTTSIGGAPALAIDAVSWERELAPGDHADMLANWESAWIDIGGEG
jgi:hypothetical protein